MGHPNLVFDKQQAVKERLALEVERAVHEVLGAFEAALRAADDVLHGVDGAEILNRGPDIRLEQAVNHTVGDQPLPKGVVALDVFVGVDDARGAVVTPRIASVELVTAGPGQHDLDELARPAGRHRSWDSTGQRADPPGAISTPA